MIRFLTLLLVMSLLPLCGVAETPLVFTGDLTGVYTWPEGASEAEASYVYRYAYPQVAGDSSLALTINNVFDYEASDALGFECPMIGSDHPADKGQMLVEITYEIVHLSSDSLSVKTDKTVSIAGQLSSRIVKAYNFTLTGSAAGTVTSLPYMLGIIKVGETDEWLINRQIEKANTCARDMVWELVERDMKKAESPIYEDMTLEEFEWGFYPEEDYYLDEEGNFVFYIQEGVIAPAEAGQFFYSISLEDLLDEI